MHKSTKILKEARRRPKNISKIGVLGLLALSSIAFTIIVVGQQGANVQKKELTDKLGEGVNAKEPHFRLVTKHKRTKEDLSNLLGWTSGEDFVSATAYEWSSKEEAEAKLKATINNPVSVTVHTLELKNVGDEAYIRTDMPYSKAGYTHVFFRRGNILVDLSASSAELAKRFAKHIVDEIDKP